MSNLIITKVSALCFNTWEQFECDFPNEYGLVMISGKARVLENINCKNDSLGNLGGKSSNEEISTPNTKDWNATKVEVDMNQVQYDGTTKTINLSRTK